MVAGHKQYGVEDWGQSALTGSHHLSHQRLWQQPFFALLKPHTYAYTHSHTDTPTHTRRYTFKCVIMFLEIMIPRGLNKKERLFFFLAFLVPFSFSPLVFFLSDCFTLHSSSFSCISTPGSVIWNAYPFWTWHTSTYADQLGHAEPLASVL